ncbi:MAG: amidohydrolase family protein [Brevinematia bacterium]
MTIIDVHTHIFPDNIAENAMKSLSHGELTYYGNGTLNSLLTFMKEDGVDFSMNQPVATKPEQVKSINRKVVEWNKLHINFISFGALHPELSKEELDDEIEFLTLNGVKGIKLHPEYQCFYPDDPKMTEIYEKCNKYGLFIFFHAGKDISFKTVHGTPKRFAEVAKIKNLKIILAHMGGYKMWDEVGNTLVGLMNVYFDTSFCGELENHQMKELIFAHSPYHILFGSDFPWERAINMIKKIKSLDLGYSIEELIFYKNARWLFDL